MADQRTTPPPLQAEAQGPTAKEKKYDRQLRLWAAAGQEALENADILLLNSGPGVVGVETLKNLVLPGIHSFTIVDDAVVSEEDLGVNFFLSESSLGKSRAEECCIRLKELNSEVRGHALQKSIKDFVQDPVDFTHYTLILLIGRSQEARDVYECATHYSIPLFYIHSIGFYSQFSIQLPPQFPIVDSHPDPASTQDLRLLNPWPELVDFTKQKTKDLDSLHDHDHGHIPYLLLLLHFLEEWKASHDGKAPANYSEKKELKSLVEAGARTSNAEGGEENFDEAAAAVLKSLNPPTVPSGLREVFDSEDCKTLTKDSTNFWIITQAIHQFHSNHQVLPLPGALPDMKAQSADYIALQTLYKRKARKDLAEVTRTVRTSEKLHTRNPPVDEKEIEAFCKGAAFVKLLKGRTIPLPFPHAGTIMEWTPPTSTVLRTDLKLSGPDSLVPIFLAFLAHDIASTTPSNSKKGGPQTPSGGRASDWTQELLSTLLTADTAIADPEIEQIRSRLRDVTEELERAGEGELHNVSALTGGMVAQEVIKVVTRQYVPVDNTCVFDGVGSRTAVFRL